MTAAATALLLRGCGCWSWLGHEQGQNLEVTCTWHLWHSVRENVGHTLCGSAQVYHLFFWVADVPQVSVKFANKCQTKIWILKQLLHGKSVCGHLRIVSSRFKRTVNKTGKQFSTSVLCRFVLADFQLVSRFPLYRAWSVPGGPTKTTSPATSCPGTKPAFNRARLHLGDRGPHGHKLQLTYYHYYVFLYTVSIFISAIYIYHINIIK